MSSFGDCDTFCSYPSCTDVRGKKSEFCKVHQISFLAKRNEIDDCNTTRQVFEVNDSNPKDLIGAKKPRLSLVPPSGLVYAALAMANGAEKYGPYNWREKKVQAMIYLEACMRHILSWQDGEENATDSGVSHLGHAIACLLILIDAKETENLIDNRPKPGAMAQLIDKFTKKG